MVYARVRTQVRRSHFLGRVGGWKAGNNPVCARSTEPVRSSVVVVIFPSEAIRLICETEA